MTTSKKVLFKLTALLWIALVIVGCISPPKEQVSIGVSKQMAWFDSLDEGLRIRLTAAAKAAAVYHLACDTPVEQFSNENVSQRMAQMVTEARDLNRRSDSYATRQVAAIPRGVRINLSERGLSLVVRYDYGNNKSEMVVESTRGKEILRQSNNYCWYAPFYQIVTGDRGDLSDIPGFVARIIK